MPPPRGRGPTSWMQPRTTARARKAPARPRGRARHSSLRPKVVPPYSCRRGPSAHTTAGRGRSAPGATEGSPSDGPGSQARASPCPRKTRQTGQTDRQVQPPARRGKGKGSPSRPTGEWAGASGRAGPDGGRSSSSSSSGGGGSRRGSPPAARSPQPRQSPCRCRRRPSATHDRAQDPRRRPRPERAPGADGGKPEPTPVLRKTRQAGRQAKPGPAALGPRGRGGRRGREKPKPSPGQPRKTWLNGLAGQAARPPTPLARSGQAAARGKGPSGRRAAAAAATQQAKGGARLRRPALPPPPAPPPANTRTRPPLPTVGGAGPQPTRPATGPSIRPAGAGAWRALGGDRPPARQPRSLAQARRRHGGKDRVGDARPPPHSRPRAALGSGGPRSQPRSATREPRTQPPLPIVGGAGPQATRPETGPSTRPAGAGAWRALGGDRQPSQTPTPTLALAHTHTTVHTRVHTHTFLTSTAEGKKYIERSMA